MVHVVEEGPVSHARAAVWMDQHEARIFFVSANGVEAQHATAPGRHVHRHPKGQSEGHEHPDDLHRYFDEVAQVLQGAEQVYLVGPSTLKFSFVKYLHANDRVLAAKVEGVESSDHPTDAQLIALARHHFGLPKPRILPSQR